MRQHISHDSPWLKSGVLSAHYLNEYHEEAEMSQAENAAATSLRPKRAYQKGKPMTDYERKRASLNRKSETHKNLNIYIQNYLKDSLVCFCEEDGLTQAEFIERLLKQESIRRKQRV